ncbi:hypothetical protein WN944_026830 [Citrus x changshan-huyou]|uniref:Uncharacterized protein n=1 Tax=Citrus x changshan-huyou TaxID=2935761 RepID=A0AAP0LGT0_9ROSI
MLTGLEDFTMRVSKASTTLTIDFQGVNKPLQQEIILNLLTQPSSADSHFLLVGCLKKALGQRRSFQRSPWNSLKRRGLFSTISQIDSVSSNSFNSPISVHCERESSKADTGRARSTYRLIEGLNPSELGGRKRVSGIEESQRQKRLHEGFNGVIVEVMKEEMDDTVSVNRLRKCVIVEIVGGLIVEKALSSSACIDYGKAAPYADYSKNCGTNSCFVAALWQLQNKGAEVISFMDNLDTERDIALCTHLQPLIGKVGLVLIASLMFLASEFHSLTYFHSSGDYNL